MRRRLAIAAIVLLLVSATVGAVTAAPQHVETKGDPTYGSGWSTLVAQENANNSTTHHDNPETSRRQGDLLATQRWLGGFMADRLERGAIQLSQGQYEKADRLIGEDYQDAFGKYVDVAGQTDETDATNDFESARRNQEELTNKSRTYEELYREYQQARDNGNTARARQLARRMERLSNEINRSGRRLIGNYRNLSNATGRTFEPAMPAINETVEEVQERQTAIRADLFTQTDLAVETNRSTFSFRRPLGVTGQLTMANGSALANRSVVIVLGERRYQVTTDESGRFTLSYRPVLVPVTTETVTVRYDPAATSPYLPTKTEVDASVTQVPSELSVNVEPTTIGIGDSVQISGTVTAAGREVDGLPVAVTIGDERLATTTTGDGSYAVAETVPPTLRAEQDSITAAVAVSDRAVGPSSDTVGVTLTLTDTDLTTHAAVESGDVVVTGRLEAVDATALPGRTIRLSVGDEVVATGRTLAEGGYRIAVPVSEVRTLTETRDATVTVSYAGEPRLLSEATQSDRVRLPPPGGQTDGDESGSSSITETLEEVPVWQTVLATIGLLLGIGAIWWLFNDRIRDAGERLVVRMAILAAILRDSIGSSDADQTPARPTPGDEAQRSIEQPTHSLPLERARASLPDDPKRAVRLAFGETRRRLGSPETATHWEFYHDARDRVTDAEGLQLLTRAYERAVYADSIDDETAQAAIDAADRVTSEIATDGGNTRP